MIILVLVALIVGRITGVVSPGDITSHAIAALAAGGVFYLLASLAGGKLMGGGDVKLVFLIGLVLGGTNTLVAMFIGFNSAAVVGIGLIVAKLKKRKDYLPFGPFLLLGMGVAYLFGSQIVSAYLRFVI
jgi:leader peptidase (prepilin peptidase)/N-methyltransferase